MNVGLQVHHAACRCRWALGPSIGNEHHTHGGGGGVEGGGGGGRRTFIQEIALNEVTLGEAAGICRDLQGFAGICRAYMRAHMRAISPGLRLESEGWKQTIEDQYIYNIDAYICIYIYIYI
jgi:hypothetical protein